MLTANRTNFHGFQLLNSKCKTLIDFLKLLGDFPPSSVSSKHDQHFVSLPPKPAMLNTKTN